MWEAKPVHGDIQKAYVQGMRTRNVRGVVCLWVMMKLRESFNFNLHKWKTVTFYKHRLRVKESSTQR